MSTQQSMVGYVIQFTNGTSRRGTVGVPLADPQQACKAVVSLIRGGSSGHANRPAVFADFLPSAVEDVSVVYLGVA